MNRLLRTVLVGVLLSVAIHAAGAQEASQSSIARVVVWRIRPGMKQQFEEGYKRHLEWHRSNHDPWSWYGWNIVSGDRFGSFVDGTFFHSWAEIDSPVAPAEDSADNARNVSPYAEIVSAAMYESVPTATHVEAARLSSLQPQFVRIEVEPGRGREFETLVGQAAGGGIEEHAYLLLRPLDGTSEYLLLLPGEKESDLAHHAALTSRILELASRSSEDKPLVKYVRTETGAFRGDLSHVVKR